jgi:hypothetical protein
MLICKLLALNVNGLIGKPLTNNPSDDRRQVWKGQMTNGDWIIKKQRVKNHRNNIT